MIRLQEKSTKPDRPVAMGAVTHGPVIGPVIGFEVVIVADEPRLVRLGIGCAGLDIIRHDFKCHPHSYSTP